MKAKARLAKHEMNGQMYAQQNHSSQQNLQMINLAHIQNGSQFSADEQACISKYLNKPQAQVYKDLGACSPRQVLQVCGGEIMNTKRSKMSFNESAVRDKESRENQSLPSVDYYET